MGFKDMLKKKNDAFEDEELGYEENYDDGAYDDGYSEQPAGNTFGGGSTLELKVVRPEGYEAAPQIADHLLNGCTVVLNLEATNKETARRLIDFLSGVAYSIEGSLRRVANNTFVITPNNVDVSGDKLEESAKAAPRAQQESNDFGF